MREQARRSRGRHRALYWVLAVVALVTPSAASQPPKGKDLAAALRDLEDHDPTVREAAARDLPGFGSAAARAPASTALLGRMQAERDPEVRAALYAAAGAVRFEAEADGGEALRQLTSALDGGDGPPRLAAVRAVAEFGHQEATVRALTGRALNDPSHRTRQAIAAALGRVGSDAKTGPSMRALTALADRLAGDECAAVRVEALRSTLALGPPWAWPKAAGAGVDPPSEPKSVVVLVRYLRARVGDPRMKLPAREKDARAEVLARLVLMRFEPKEVNEENLDALVARLPGVDAATKAQARQALQPLGIRSRKLDDALGPPDDKGAPPK